MIYSVRFARDSISGSAILDSAYPGKIALTFIHAPLPEHPLAVATAVGAECAGRQGRFREFVGIAFELIDSLGQVELEMIAQRAGVQQLEAFTDCLDSPAALAQVHVGKALSDSLHLRGTPTVLFNGWIVSGLPTDSLMLFAVRTAAEGKRLKLN